MILEKKIVEIDQFAHHRNTITEDVDNNYTENVFS